MCYSCHVFENIPQLTVRAPAKINLHLEVKDTRSDGFHNLESIFLAMDFGDILHFEPIPGTNAVDIAMEQPDLSKTELKRKSKQCSIPLQSNIIYKALSMFRDKTGFKQGLKIKVEKYIPIGGGLGGGSSDAAAALLVLNKMAGSPLSRGSLLDLAASLGSDVPFFVHETPAALITGRGEFIKPIKAPCLFFVLVNPGFPSNTAAAFRLLDEYRKSGKRNEKLEKRKEESEKGKNVQLHFSFPFSHSSFFNDFLPVFDEKEKTIYYEIISQLQESGADYASLSGAGSTCFGVFKDRENADKAARVLKDKWGFVECCGLWTE